MVYIIECPNSRLVVAQGIWYANKETIEAEDLKTAIMLFHEKYETRMPVIYNGLFYFRDGVCVNEVCPDFKTSKEY